VDRTCQALPGLPDHWRINIFVKDSLVDAPGKAITEKARTAGFRVRVMLRIKQIRPPQTILVRKCGNLCGHVLKECYIIGIVEVGRRKILQYPSQPSQDPTIAAGPEEFFAIWRGSVKVAIIAVKQKVVGIIEVFSRIPVHLI